MSSGRALYFSDYGPITQQDIEHGLVKVGLKKGDIVLLHSDVGSFGKLGDIKDKDVFLGSILNAFFNVIGKEGTLVVPTYTYSFCKNETFDLKNSKSTTGLFSEFLRNQPAALRSEDPIFSHAAIGRDAEKLIMNVSSLCFAEDSFFDRLYKSNGKIINFGKFFDITFLHYIEKKFGVDYRFDKNFSGTVIKKDGSKEKKDMVFYVRYNQDNGRNVEYEMPLLGDELEKRGLLKRVNLGSSFMLCSDAKNCYEVGFEMLSKDHYSFLKSNPNTLVSKDLLFYNVDKDMYDLMNRLFPICRSITGNGIRETLRIIQEYIPIKIHEVLTGTKVFDWIVPKEWNIKDAYVMDSGGNKAIDFKKNNLHVVGYSIPVNKIVPLSELQEHLYSFPDQSEAVPYVTSYYKESWGFCIAHKDREQLKEGEYKVFIDSELKDGALTYGELIIPGKSEKEVFLSTYVCHPSMANNELSGPAVTTFLTKWILSKQRRYTYRIIFIPETIGSIAYLSKNLEIMKKNVLVGFNISCVGDNKVYSYLATRNGNTYADKVALNILSFKHPDFIKYSFLNRGSDERQYNSPGVDLPVCSVMRSKYGTYPEYHTSLDNLDFVSPQGLYGAYEALRDCLELIEENRKYKINCLGEPQLGKRGLRPTIGTKHSYTKEAETMSNFIAYADGQNDLIDISNKIKVGVWQLYPVIEKLMKADLLTVVDG